MSNNLNPVTWVISFPSKAREVQGVQIESYVNTLYTGEILDAIIDSDWNSYAHIASCFKGFDYWISKVGLSKKTKTLTTEFKTRSQNSWEYRVTHTRSLVIEAPIEDLKGTKLDNARIRLNLIEAFKLALFGHEFWFDKNIDDFSELISLKETT